jgi:arginine exporter protein ArgO
MAGPELFIAGTLVMAAFVIGLYFLKYWRLSKDRFFIWFAIAFWVFGLGWILRAFDPGHSEHGHLAYLPRLVAFLMIIVAILDKNRRSPQ